MVDKRAGGLESVSIAVPLPTYRGSFVGAFGVYRMYTGHLDLHYRGDNQVNDTFDDSINGRIYHAYLDWRGVEALETVRIGRQLMHEGPELAWFDGLHVGSAEFTDLAIQAAGDHDVVFLDVARADLDA